MIRGWLSDFVPVTGGELVGGDVSFSGLATDTRSLAEGELFVALRGERYDAHAFLDRAAAAGAAALVVERIDSRLALAQLRVSDTLAALGAIARHWRTQLDPVVIGVTGSNGKTTVKNLIAAMLGPRKSVLATRGNLNNDIGVPLTLVQLARLHRVAVVEMGCSRPGDIARLAAMAMPDIAVVTNAAAAHLELLGSVAGVAREKGALFAALGTAGAAVLNADDAHAEYWRGIIGRRRTVSFGTGAQADVRLSRYRDLAPGEAADGALATFRLSGAVGEIVLRSPLPGMHNALNAAAAAAAAMLAGARADDIAGGVASVSAAAGRLAVTRPAEGIVLVDDTYNANPDSLRAAVDWVTGMRGRAWLVLGDMAELGGDADAVHARCAAHALAAGVERIFTLGGASAAAARAAGPAGAAFEDREALAEAVAAALEPGVNVLVKGSRSAGMEEVVSGVRERLRRRGSSCSSC